ncbi:MAG TPA: hypothetical protein VF126_16075 [Acidobacteriaceae bacterium]
MLEHPPIWVLVRHFFSCFFANEHPDSVFGPATLALQLAASLGVPPALMVLCLIPSYYGLDPWGIPRTPWLQAQDHFDFITYACTVVGMVAVLTWERFLPTLLEARVLGSLPIPRRLLFFGKLLAMALFLGTFLIGSSLPAAVLIVGFANSHQVKRHFATHLLALGLFGCFTATSCLALLSITAMFPAGVRRTAVPLLQAALIACLLLSLFFSPTMAPSLQALVTSHSRILLWMPAAWFTGIYEFVLHTTSIGRAFAGLATFAIAATLVSSAAFLLLYPLAYRTRAASLLEGEGTKPIRVHRRIPSRSTLLAPYLPLPTQRAAFYFVGQTLLRVQHFRALSIFASCAAFALTATIMAKLRIVAVYPYLRISSHFPVTTTVAFCLSSSAAFVCCSAPTLSRRPTGSSIASSGAGNEAWPAVCGGGYFSPSAPYWHRLTCRSPIPPSCPRFRVRRVCARVHHAPRRMLSPHRALLPCLPRNAVRKFRSAPAFHAYRGAGLHLRHISLEHRHDPASRSLRGQ